jgi:competence ComEA-like helix-hairpin-helix protein
MCMRSANLSRLLSRAQVRVGLTRSEFRGVLVLTGMLLAGVVIRQWRFRVSPIDPAVYEQIEAEFERRSWRTPLPDPLGPPFWQPEMDPLVAVVPVLSPDRLLDLNLATAARLQDLPRIGPRLAERILEHRERYGPFRTVDDLLMIQGIGNATLDRLKPLVTVNPVPRPSENLP